MAWACGGSVTETVASGGRRATVLSSCGANWCSFIKILLALPAWDDATAKSAVPRLLTLRIFLECRFHGFRFDYAVTLRTATLPLPRDRLPFGRIESLHVQQAVVALMRHALE